MSETQGTGTISNIDTGAIEGGGQATDTEAKPKSTEEWFEFLLDGNKEPTKVPLEQVVEKLKEPKVLEKLNPHLAKLRSESDRKVSLANQRLKEIEQVASEWKSIQELATQAKNDSSVARQLAEKLGVPKQVLQRMSEEVVAEKIKEALRAEEEKENPKLKEERETNEEVERLRKENEELKKNGQTEFQQRVDVGVNQFMVRALDYLQPALREEAAQEMVHILRATNESEAELTEAQLALRALKAMDERRSFYTQDSEREKEVEKLRKENEELKAKARVHPAATNTWGTSNGASRQSRELPIDHTPPATDLLLKFLR